MEFRKIAKNFINAPFTRQLMLEMLKGYKRPNDKILELVKKGELIILKKGMYILGPKTELPSLDPFLIANHLWGPSYISLESAMSHWGLIPERVYEISSVTLKISKAYKTPKGRFTYRHLPSPYYGYGVKNIELLPNQVALIAGPEKAICDKIVATSGVSLRSPSQVQNFLTQDLRIDTDRLKNLDIESILSWADEAPKKSSLLMLAKTLRTL